MKDSASIHKKVQEMCDCFAATDPLREMSALINDPEKENAAVKWIALAALHGVTANAKKISISVGKDGTSTVVAEYREAELPSPGADVGRRIYDAVKDMTHIEANKGKTALALGIRDSSIDLQVKIKKKDDSNRITIAFPK